ncbi:hypothetical protein DFJ73DRAFT_807442 [Zopfochytrium polystomum]|nr:hypothetical protein DFJ73DRAFT_807442 [Zopfochytrium polystomum]
MRSGRNASSLRQHAAHDCVQRPQGQRCHRDATDRGRHQCLGVCELDRIRSSYYDQFSGLDGSDGSHGRAFTTRELQLHRIEGAVSVVFAWAQGQMLSVRHLTRWNKTSGAMARPMTDGHQLQWGVKDERKLRVPAWQHLCIAMRVEGAVMVGAAGAATAIGAMEAMRTIR